MNDLQVIAEAKRRFRSLKGFHKKADRERLEMAIYTAGDQWGKAPTPEQMISALDAAGFKIVRKPRPRQ